MNKTKLNTEQALTCHPDALKAFQLTQSLFRKIVLSDEPIETSHGLVLYDDVLVTADCGYGKCKTHFVSGWFPLFHKHQSELQSIQLKGELPSADIELIAWRYALHLIKNNSANHKKLAHLYIALRACPAHIKEQVLGSAHSTSDVKNVELISSYSRGAVRAQLKSLTSNTPSLKITEAYNG